MNSEEQIMTRPRATTGTVAFPAWRRFLLRVLASVLFFLPLSAQSRDDSPASRPDLLVAPQGGTMTTRSAGVYSVRLNVAGLAGLRPGEEARLSIPGLPERRVRFERSEIHANGDMTWIGSIVDGADGHRVVLTNGAQGTIGTLRTPEGEFLLDMADGGRLRSATRSALSKAQTCQEVLPVPQSQAPSSPAGNLRSTSDSEIDVMVLYTPGLAGSGSPATIINQLVAVANQAYLDSSVGIRLRLVHSAQVSYSDTGSNSLALDALSDNSGSAFAGVEALRAEKGADLVALLRPYHYASQDSCGVAWLNGGEGQSLTSSGGYAVVSYGSDGSYYCDDLTFSHELGHNMGSAHDAAHSSQQGAYPYSYGYGISGIFGTIMSYIDPAIGRFSSPSQTCAGRTCGTTSANNVLSLNNTRATVGGFMAARSTVALTGLTITPASLSVGATATLTPVPSNASLGTCTSSNTAVAAISGSTLTAVGAGSASVTCSGISATVTVSAAASTQTFSTTYNQTRNASGNVALSLSFRPKGADIGKSAMILVAAAVQQPGATTWFMLGSNGWTPGLSLTPLATRALGAFEQDIAVLNYEFSETLLRDLQVDILIGYQVSGSSDIVYGVARSFR
jgi:hypothetical protein